MKRRKFSPKAKAEVRARQDDLCPYCTRSLATGRVEYDHVLPLALGGADDATNLQAVHSSCHSIFKTSLDRAQITKATRQGGGRGSREAKRAAREAKGLGPTFPSRPFPASQQKMQSRPFPKPWKPERTR